jgi:hypothetical protein
MKSIKKLKFQPESSFRIIESGLSTNQLSRMELASIMGGMGNDYYDTAWCGVNACGIEACVAQACVVDVCPIWACVVNLLA